MTQDHTEHTGQTRSFRKALAGVVAIAALSFFAASTRASDRGQVVRTRVLQNSAERIVLQYELGEMTRRTITIGGVKHAQILLGKESPIKQRGAPDLPNVCRSIVIPPDAAMTARVLKSSYYEVSDINVAPSKGILSRTLDPDEVPYTFGEAYRVDAFFPGDLVTLRDPYIMRDYRGVVVVLNPFQYDPGRRTLRVYTEMIVELVPIGPGKVNVKIPTPSRELSRAFNEVYERRFVNYAPPARYQPLDESGDMLIIAHDAWLANVQPLVDHRNARGIDTTLVGVSSIGNNASAIKGYIQTVYEVGDLAFVLLVGDASEVATPMVTVGAETGAADPTYALLDGSDHYPDILVGRFSAQSAAQVETQVWRTIEYELMPATTQDWYLRAVGIGSDEGAGIGDDGESDKVHLENIRLDLEAHGYAQVDGIYDPGATAAQVTAAVNAGRGLINYCGHGISTGWTTTGFSNSNVNALTNDNQLPLIISVACDNGQFNGMTCFAEAWMRATHGSEPTGAVGIYASSIDQAWAPPMAAQDEVVDLLVTEAYSTFGALCFAGSCLMMDEYGLTGESTFDTWQLFGDPALRVVATCVNAGVVTLDRPKYACESTATIQVIDCGPNTSDLVVDRVEVLIDSDSEPSGESVELTEISPAASEFIGSIPLRTTDGAGVLYVRPGDTITVTYIDEDDGAGGSDILVRRTAPVDCEAPIILEVATTEVEPRSAVVVLTTDEPARGAVHFGRACDSLDEQATDTAYTIEPIVPITGLEDDTTYFYAVEAEDEAGNVSFDDNGGVCYSFTTPEIPDFFTELFTGDNDLDDLSITFTPNGGIDFYAACTEEIAELPTDPAGGTAVSLIPDADDGCGLVNLSGGAEVSLYGIGYSSFYVGSNGYLTFGQDYIGFNENFVQHFLMPRISALFDDLDPSSGGSVTWKQLADRAVVTWLDVPKWDTNNANTAQVELYFDGTIVLSYLAVDITDGLAGLSEGEGLSPDFYETDLSALSEGCGPRAPTANGGTATTPRNVPVLITLSGGDDGFPDPPGVLTYIITSLPMYGTLSDPATGAIDGVPYPLVGLGDGNEVRYTPAPDYEGNDGFEFKVNDGGDPPDGGDSNEATVAVAVVGLQLAHSFPLDDDPGWSTEGEWAWGRPMGEGSHDGDPSSGYTGSKVYGYNLAGDYPNDLAETYLTTTALDCSGLVETELRFRRWLGVESATYDHANLQVSNDGLAWSTVWEHTGNTVSEAWWSLQAYDISAVADGQVTVYIRWGMGPTDYMVTYPGWNIDDVEILGAAPPRWGDFDGNGVVDLADFAYREACETGPEGGPIDPVCEFFDFDRDGDVDMVDFKRFMDEFGTE